MGGERLADFASCERWVFENEFVTFVTVNSISARQPATPSIVIVCTLIASSVYVFLLTIW
jgi:hypothetical protein